MARHVALLRGIGPLNPKMRNAELVGVLERLGFDEVRAVATSGNLLFETDEDSTATLERLIEAALHEHLGAPCTTIVRSRLQIGRVAGLDVFDDHADGPTDRCHVTFLKRRQRDSSPPDDRPGAVVVAVRGQTVFSVIDSTRAETAALMGRLEKAYGREITTRSWKSVQRIARALDS